VTRLRNGAAFKQFLPDRRAEDKARSTVRNCRKGMIPGKLKMTSFDSFLRRPRSQCRASARKRKTSCLAIAVGSFQMAGDSAGIPLRTWPTVWSSPQETFAQTHRPTSVIYPGPQKAHPWPITCASIMRTDRTHD
jgi:hypothetical protein